MPQSATYVLSIRATHDPTRNTEQAWHPAGGHPPYALFSLG